MHSLFAPLGQEPKYTFFFHAFSKKPPASGVFHNVAQLRFFFLVCALERFRLRGFCGEAKPKLGEAAAGCGLFSAVVVIIPKCLQTMLRISCLEKTLAWWNCNNADNVFWLSLPLAAAGDAGPSIIIDVATIFFLFEFFQIIAVLPRG